MAQYEEFIIDQGSDLALELHLINNNGSVKNLKNYSVAAKLKKTYTSDSSDTTTFTSVVTDATSGIVTLELTNTQTGALKKGRYVYDVEISFVDSSANTIIERVLEGVAIVTPSVTK